MKSFFKILLLAIIDAVTLYLSYYVSFLALQLMGMQGTDLFISNAYIFVPIKLVIYMIFFMYSMNKYRSILLDVLGIIIANAATIFAASYLYQLVIQENITYFAIAFVFDAVIAVMVRYLIRNSNDSYEEDDDEYEESFQNKQNEQNAANFQSSIFDVNNFQPEPQPAAQIPPQIPAPDPLMLEQQREKDRKIDMLMEQLEEKEQRIQILENKITMQSNMAYQNYSTSESYIDNNKKEILDKILDDIKSLYSTLNSRTKLVEEREYNLLLKMVELEEKQRALDLIQRQNRDDFPERDKRYQRKRIHNATYPTPLALPRDNPNLTNNIMKTLEILNTPSATAPIILAEKANDEVPYVSNVNTAKQQPIKNTVNESKPAGMSAIPQPEKLISPIQEIAKETEQLPQAVKPVQQPLNMPQESKKPQAMQIAKPLAQETKQQNTKVPPKQAVDFNTIKTNKVDINTEELDKISSLIDIL